MQIRAAVPDDAEAIATINVDSWRATYAGHVPDELLAALDPAPRVEQGRRALARTDRLGATLVAVDDSGAVVGYTHYGPLRDGGQPHPTEGEIYAIYVTPTAWGTGAGRALMAGALAALAAQRRDPVRLWVLPANDRARRFYERAGFTPDGAHRVESLTLPEGVAELPEMRYARLG